MIRLPAALERRLAELFPRTREREQFVANLIEQHLDDPQTADTSLPEAIGGTVHLFSDGGSRGNPGQAAIGCILEDPIRGTVLREYAAAIGVETNNVAEYRALIEGMKLARTYHPNHLICHLDSELVVRQLNGQYQVKVASLQTFYDEVKALMSEFPHVTFTHVPRADNFRADALVNRALDEAQKSPPHARHGIPQRSMFEE
jgi:ribonuclease HI